MKRFGRVRLLAMQVFWLLGSAAAFAQDKGEKQPPYDVNGLPPEKVWVPWLFAFLFIVGCVAIALKNPRRSHLD